MAGIATYIFTGNVILEFYGPGQLQHLDRVRQEFIKDLNADDIGIYAISAARENRQ